MILVYSTKLYNMLLEKFSITFFLWLFTSNKSAWFFFQGSLFHSFIMRVILDQFYTRNHPFSFCSLYFNINKWFSHKFGFCLCDFVVWVRLCVVYHLIRHCLVLRLVAIIIWFILKDQLFKLWFEHQCCRFKNMNFSMTLILSYNL